MRPTRARKLSSTILATCLATVYLAGPAAAFNGETCLTPPPDDLYGFHVQGGPQMVRYDPDDPICSKYVDIDGGFRCGGWLGLSITHRPLAVEHHLVIDLSQLAYGAGGGLVIWESLREGETDPTMRLRVVGGAAPELAVDLQSDDRSTSAVAALSESEEQHLVIRWTAPTEIDSGAFEVSIDGVQIVSEEGLTFDQKLPDFIRVGAMNCPTGWSGKLVFDPVKTIFEHF